MQVYYDKDADLETIKNNKVVIVGYGSQGHAHANNLKDSGGNVTVALRKESTSWAKAEAAGLNVQEVSDAVKDADMVMILMPDELQSATYKSEIESNIKQGAVLAFAHGFNIHFDMIEPREDLDVIMVAPKGPGHTVRSQYEIGAGVPCLLAIHKDVSGNAKEIGLSYASAIGSGRAGIIETNFKDETETEESDNDAKFRGSKSKTRVTPDNSNAKSKARSRSTSSSAKFGAKNSNSKSVFSKNQVTVLCFHGFHYRVSIAEHDLHLHESDSSQAKRGSKTKKSTILGVVSFCLQSDDEGSLERHLKNHVLELFDICESNSHFR